MFLNVVCYDKCYRLLRFGNCPASLIKKNTNGQKLDVSILRCKDCCSFGLFTTG